MLSVTSPVENLCIQVPITHLNAKLVASIMQEYKIHNYEIVMREVPFMQCADFECADKGAMH